MFGLSSRQSSSHSQQDSTSFSSPRHQSLAVHTPCHSEFSQPASSLSVCEREAKGFSGLSWTWMVIRLCGQSSKITRKSIRGPGKLGTSLRFTWNPCGCKRTPQSPQSYRQNLRRLGGEKQTPLPRSSNSPFRSCRFIFEIKAILMVTDT